jgi:uncharacterized protein
MPVFQYPVMFPSDGVLLMGRVYRPVDNLADPLPTAVVTGSWLTVKEQMPHTYAMALAERGYTAFTFDFTGFGQSGGEPRQLEHPERKIRDIVSAASYLSSAAFVRGAPGHLGICASAQYALAAIAHGARVRSFASVAGWYHDPPSVGGWYGGAPGMAMRLERGSKAQERWASSRELSIVPAYKPGDDRAGMFFDLDYYGNAGRGAIPAWKNEMAEMSWLYWLTFDGLRAAKDVSVPTVFVHSKDAVFPDHVQAVHDALRGPKRLEWTGGTQIDFYDQAPQVTRAMEIVDEHFRRTLEAS